MPLIANEQEIKERSEIVPVLSLFTDIRRKGAEYIGLCPFHNEKSPSFHVHPVKGIFKCFGCGAGGNVVDFMMMHEKLSYPDALRWVAAYFHIDIIGESQAYSIPARIKRERIPQPPVEYIQQQRFEASLSRYGSNNFAVWLHTVFDASVVKRLIETYRFGTSKLYSGGVVFWQIDNLQRIRTGKIMPYNPITGKRDRAAKPASNWAHTQLGISNFEQCLFGLHLLNTRPDAPIAIVESEKTCIVASVFWPQFIWMATGGKELQRKKFEALTGRSIVLFPDMGALAEWQEIASQLSGNYNIKVSSVLDEMAERYNLPEKSDLCDALVSEQLRRELINNYKQELLDRDPGTQSEIAKIRGEFINRGLRIQDALIANAELQQILAA